MLTKVITVISVFLVVVGISSLIGMFTIPYCVNMWLLFFGREALISKARGALIGIFVPATVFSIPFSIITYIIMLFLI